MKYSGWFYLIRGGATMFIYWGQRGGWQIKSGWPTSAVLCRTSLGRCAGDSRCQIQGRQKSHRYQSSNHDKPTTGCTPQFARGAGSEDIKQASVFLSEQAFRRDGERERGEVTSDFFGDGIYPVGSDRVTRPSLSFVPRMPQ